MSDVFALLFFVIIVLWGGISFYRSHRITKRAEAIAEQVKSSDPLYCSSHWYLTKYRLDSIVAPENSRARWRRGKWRRCVLVVTEKHVAVYAVERDEDEKFAFTPGELRWFGRPVKYRSGVNEMWMHAQIGATWHLLRVKLYRLEMQALVRAMKQIATYEQVKAYRRRRPYIHRGPKRAHPATQDIHGAWSLDAPVDLYLTPLFLVIFHAGEVAQEIALSDIQQIGAFKRLDAPQSDGLVRFTIEARHDLHDDTLAFALEDYEAWAAYLAEAAKRTLEEPVLRKGKEEEWDDD